MVVLLVFHGQVRLAAQGSEGEQTRARARDWRDAGRLQARGVGGQLNRGSVGSVGQVLSLELLLLWRHTNIQWVSGKTQSGGTDNTSHSIASQQSAASSTAISFISSLSHFNLGHTTGAETGLTLHWNEMISGRLQAKPSPKTHTSTHGQRSGSTGLNSRVQTQPDTLYTLQMYFNWPV